MKYFCIGRNYVEHIQELKNQTPSEPIIFIKPETALHKGKKYLLPTHTQELHYECELVLLFDKDVNANNVIDEWQDIVSHISLGIDFTARDTQSRLKEKGLPWEIAKGFDNSAIIGNWVPIQDFNGATSFTFSFHKGNQVLQQGDTNMMIFSILDTINYILKYYSIQVGDVLFTGTPSGVGLIEKGNQYRGSLMDLEVLSFET